MARAVRAVLVSLAATFAVGVCGACGGSRGAARPVASLAATKEASEAFAPIRDAWASAAKPETRAKLAAPLEAFLARFPKDGLAPLARTYLAFARMDAKDLAGADAELALVPPAPPGATRDLADIGAARVMRLRGQAELAFEKLRPLVGKVVDATARAILQEEVSLAAIESHRDYEAVAYMDVWLRNANEEDRDAAHARVAAALGGISEPVLENALRVMRAGGAASGYGREIQRLVTERLAAIALERGDSDLARWLVAGDAGGALLGANEGALGELATTHRGLAMVDGRTIGLVLPTGSSDLRDEAAAVMRGVARALDLPRADPALGDRTKLVTRDDGGDVARVEPAMSELAGEGAAVILAALEPTSGDRAVKWGEEHGVVVIVLAVPAAMPARDWAFVIGVSHDAEIAALGEELVSRAVTRLVPIVPRAGSPGVEALTRGSVTLAAPVVCDTAAAMSGEAPFPVADWKRDHEKAWLVDAPSECARDLVRALGNVPLEGTVALTLDASGARPHATGVKLLAVQTGSIPVAAARAREAPEDPEIAAYRAREGASPNVWVALGHDAATVARRAVASLPLDATSDAGEVKKRRAAVKDALATARGHLWTTGAEGFAGGRVMTRELAVVELPAEKPDRTGR